MKLQLITDLEDNLVAVQLPIEEFLRLKKAAGESIDQIGHSTSPPEERDSGTKESAEAAPREEATQPTPKIHHSASIAEILGRDPNEEYKHYIHTVEGSWLGKPKVGQRSVGPSADSLEKSHHHDLPRTGSHGDKKRYWSERRGSGRNKRKI